MAELSEAEGQRFLAVLNGYIYFQALASACDFDLFTLLEAHPGATQERLREQLGLSRQATRILLLSCCAAGLVQRDGSTGGYTNSSIASKVLLSTDPDSLVPFVKFSHAVQQRCCAHLTQSMREDRNAGLDELPGPGSTLYERLAMRPELEQLFHQAMGAYTRQFDRAVDAPEFAQVRHLLDVGGGDGSNAERLCRKYAGLHVTVFDSPTVCEIAAQRIHQQGLSDRIHFHPGDIFADAWPCECDGVLMSHLLEIFSEAKIRMIYRRSYEALPAGGRVFVWTLMADDNETGGLQAAKSSIYYYSTASGEGMAYPGKDHVRWMREAGFKDIRRDDARDIDHGLVIGTRSEEGPGP